MVDCRKKAEIGPFGDKSPGTIFYFDRPQHPASNRCILINGQVNLLPTENEPN
jgi:hypothetical protein